MKTNFHRFFPFIKVRPIAAGLATLATVVVIGLVIALLWLLFTNPGMVVAIVFWIAAIVILGGVVFHLWLALYTIIKNAIDDR